MLTKIAALNAWHKLLQKTVTAEILGLSICETEEDE